MILKTKTVFLLFILSCFTLISCEIANEKLEKKLLKSGGIWEIENINWNKVQRGFNALVDTGSLSGGILQFYNNGNIKYQYTLSQNQRNGLAIWYAEETDLIIEYVDLPDIPIQRFPVRYQVEHHSKHEITLSTTESYYDDFNQEITTNLAIQLKRRK